MHEKLVLFPSPCRYVEESYFVRPSVFVFYTELVSLEKIVLWRDELDSWGLLRLLVFLGRISCPWKRLFVRWCPYRRAFLYTKFWISSITSTVYLGVDRVISVRHLSFWLITNGVVLGCLFHRCFSPILGRKFRTLSLPTIFLTYMNIELESFEPRWFLNAVFLYFFVILKWCERS